MEILENNATMGAQRTAINNNFSEVQNTIKTMIFTLPIRGVTDATFNFIGEDRVHLAGETGLTFSTAFGLQNQHCALKINSLTGTGTVTFTGTSITEASGTVTTADTEVLAVTGTDELQTGKKWLEITSIAFAGVSAIDYDIEILGYLDMGNSDWELLGYRADMRTTSDSSDFALVLTKIQDDGDDKHSHIIIEDYGHDSTGTGGKFFDHKRTGADDRDATISVNLAPDDSMICYKCLDFSTYFTSDENIFVGAKDEGLIIHCEGRGITGTLSGITAIDVITLTLYYTN